MYTYEPRGTLRSVLLYQQKTYEPHEPGSYEHLMGFLNVQRFIGLFVDVEAKGALCLRAHMYTYVFICIHMC